MVRGDPVKKIVKVSVSIPNEGLTIPPAYDNRLLLACHLGTLQVLSHLGMHDYKGVHYDFPDDVEFEFYWSTVGRVLTPLARERLTEWAVEGNVDYMLMIDDDMIVPMDLFERLYRHNVDVVAPLAFMRVSPHRPVIYRVEEGYDPLMRSDYYIPHTVNNYPKDTLVECDAVGFGAALIKMDVVRRMEKPWFMSTTASGEDLWFCFKAKKAGARVFMDTSTKLGHLGFPPVIQEADFEREFKAEEFRKTYGDWLGKKGEVKNEIN